jgi:ProP effector
MTPPAERPPGRRNALLDQLLAQYPVFREGKPLAIGIHKALLAEQPELDKAALRAAMLLHTRSTRYLKGIVAGAARHDLAGNPDGSVTDEQQAEAVATLRERIRKAAERRKNEEAARKADAEARQRQEKLAKLAEKFNAR